MPRKHLTITGKVQNVWNRAWFAERAEALGLDGWVRNRADGSVEAVVDGPSDTIAEMVRLAHEGSPASRVADVLVSEDVPAETLVEFEKRATL